MSAEILRRAAEEIRDDQDREERLGHIDERTYRAWLAVSDLLDAEVFHAEYRERQQRETNKILRDGLEPYPAYYDGHTERAIAVARAYLAKPLAVTDGGDS